MASSTITIQEGDHVVFRRDGLCRVFQIRKNRQVYFEKSKLNSDDLIGQTYGSAFEIDRGKLIKFEPDRTEQLKETISSMPGADNRNLIDTESNQKMSKDDIMKMKDDGITGEKIIEELIENSETFRNKTEFSQAKYLKKKKKKHLLVFRVLRPTPRLVMEIFAKEPGKICNLRADTLSQLLNYSNVMYGSHVAVVETCQGLVLACVLQRMGGKGKLIQLVPNINNAVCRQVVDYFSFPKEHLDNMYTFPLDKLSTLSDKTQEEDITSANLSSEDSSSRDLQALADCNRSDGAESVVSTEKTEIVDDPMNGENKNERQLLCETSTNIEGPNSVTDVVDTNDDVIKKEVDTNDVIKKDVDTSDDVIKKDIDTNDDVIKKDFDTSDDVIKKEDDHVIDNSTDDTRKGLKRPLNPNRDLLRQQKTQKEKEAGTIIRNKKLDSLILACKYNPTPILMTLLDFLSPSRPVVVYCQYLEPLVECYTQIKKRGIGLQLRLSETWFREYQVLAQRTHPMMNMSGTGGYLLTFMTVQTEKAESSC